MSWHTEIDEYGREIEVDDYDEDEYYDEEDYEDDDCYWDWWGSFNTDSEDDERLDDEPSSNSSDIPFYYPLSENPDITPKGDILS